MRMVEVSAKTREEAIQRALKQLGAERHEVEVQIVDEGSRGLFGFGARDVVIKVTAEHLPDLPAPRPKPAPQPQPQARREAPAQSAAQREQRAPRPERQSRPARDARPEGEQRQRTPRPERQARPPRDARPEGEQRQERKPRPDRPARPPREERPPREAVAEREQLPAKPRTPMSEARAREAAAMLEQMIRQMGIEATVQGKLAEEDTLVLSVESPDSALLIGRKGRNLEAMQYLINRMINNGETNDESERIVIDVEGYLERRRATLEELALRLAQKAKESHRKVRLKPLAANERRVIHVTLQNDPEVRTFSVGSPSARSVVIAPADESDEPQGESSRTPDRDRDRSRRRRRPRRPRTDAPANATNGEAANGEGGLGEEPSHA